MPPLTFQIIGSTAKDVKGEYTITLFGSTADGKSVSCDITGFEPYFYVEMPVEWHSAEYEKYHAWLSAHTDAPLRYRIEHHRTFWDFTNNKDFPFMKVITTTKKSWMKLRDVCLDKDTSHPISLPTNVFGPGAPTLRVYEANIDPILRFYHLREIKPAGWVTIADDNWEDAESASTTAAIQATVDWKCISAASADVQLSNAPLRVMSWDIECTSSHGDFPLAAKTWRKPAREIVAAGITNWNTLAIHIKKAVTAPTEILSRIYLSPAGLAKLDADIEALGERWVFTKYGEDAIDRVDELLTAHLPAPEGDPIIQIGSAVYVNGVAVRKDIVVLGSCMRLPGVNVHSCATEKDLIWKWSRIIKEVDPDIMIGYNIFGFDDKYLWDRATANSCVGALKIFSRLTDRPARLVEKTLSSSAMGDNKFHTISGEGRLHIDLLAYVRRNAVLDSYSLDNVTATFMSGGVGAVTPAEDGGTTWRITTKSTKGTVVGRYVVLMDEENDVIGDKLEVIAVEPKALVVAAPDLGTALADHGPPPVRWSQSKDDVSPKDIFSLHEGGPADRARVAKYCIQDCDLVIELFQKLEVINNSVAMANVCWVPVEFIFTRGQGIKSESLVFYECRKEGQLIPVLPSPPRASLEPLADIDAAIAPVPEIVRTDDEEGYEGAIVLDPLTGIYLDDEPVAALDFSSLYPSSIISENLSHDSLVWVKDYDMEGNFVCLKEGSDQYDNLQDWDYLNVEYDILRPDPAQAHKKHPDLVAQGRRVARYAQPVDQKCKSTLPKILMKLLTARKTTRKLAEKESDEFRRNLLDAQQLAYKLTANSLYGQLGSNTSKIRRKCVAASTTGHGRQQLLFSKACVEAVYGPTAGDPRCSAVCVYGDTDSIFISFRPRDPVTGTRLKGRAAQAAAKELAEEAGGKISGALKPPHDFEFDKMFRCFCLLSKKRYVGDMTEGGLEDADYHRKSMGIVMKRRDNAPIVKYVYGGVIEHILVRRDVDGAFEFARQAVRDLLAGKFPLKRLTITKSLRAEYKSVPAHKVLADRIGKRDPGNKPASNDRIPFVYVAPPKGQKAPESQGERIETPTYIRENSLKPDYVFYVTNQIAKPVAQVFGLIVEKLPGFREHMLKNSKKRDPVDAREALAEELLFGEQLRAARNESAGQMDLRNWFKAI